MDALLSTLQRAREKVERERAGKAPRESRTPARRADTPQAAPSPEPAVRTLVVHRPTTSARPAAGPGSSSGAGAAPSMYNQSFDQGWMHDKHSRVHATSSLARRLVEQWSYSVSLALGLHEHGVRRSTAERGAHYGAPMRWGVNLAPLNPLLTKWVEFHSLLQRHRDTDEAHAVEEREDQRLGRALGERIERSMRSTAREWTHAAPGRRGGTRGGMHAHMAHETLPDGTTVDYSTVGDRGVLGVLSFVVFSRLSRTMQMVWRAIVAWLTWLVRVALHVL